MKNRSRDSEIFFLFLKKKDNKALEQVNFILKGLLRKTRFVISMEIDKSIEFQVIFTKCILVD